MSLLKHLEEEAHLLFQELQEHIKHQVNKGTKINPKLQELINHLENHVNTTSPGLLPDPVPATPVVEPAGDPVVSVPVVEKTIVVEAPQTLAEKQSAENVAN